MTFSVYNIYIYYIIYDIYIYGGIRTVLHDGTWWYIYIYIIIYVASWVGWGLQSETRTITPIHARGSSHECPWSFPGDKSFVMCR